MFFHNIRVRILASICLATLVLGVPSESRAVEFEVIFVPKVVVINGIPTVRMIPRFKPIPLPEDILPGLPMISENRGSCA